MILRTHGILAGTALLIFKEILHVGPCKNQKQHFEVNQKLGVGTAVFTASHLGICAQITITIIINEHIESSWEVAVRGVWVFRLERKADLV